VVPLQCCFPCHLYGLRQGVVHTPGEPDFAGRSLAGFGVGSNYVLSEAWLLVIALGHVGQARFEVMVGRRLLA
jgi:hypothetical protein